MRRYQDAANREEHRGVEWLLPLTGGPKQAQVGGYVSSIHRTAEGSRKEDFEIFTCGLFGRHSRTGLRDQDLRAGFGVPRRKVEHEFSRVHVLLGVDRREEERFGSVVEPFTTGGIHRE